MGHREQGRRANREYRRVGITKPTNQAARFPTMYVGV